MRLRNVKGSREQIAANEYTIKDAEQIKGQWKDYFQDGKPIQLEIGMGKGKFLMQLAELKAANKLFETAIVSKDVVNIVDADVHFHDIIYTMTDNARLIQIINNLREQMYRYRLEYVKDARTHSILISEHNDIIKQLKDRNVEHAKKVIYQHINNQEKGIIRLLNK